MQTNYSVFARVENGEILEYPVSIEDIKNREVPLSFFKQVRFEKQPLPEPFHKVVEKIAVIDGQPRVSYELVALTVQELLDSIREKTPNPKVTDVGPDLFRRVTSLVREIAGKALDDFAMEKGYDNITSLCSYTADPDEVHRNEAMKGVELRSRTWIAMRDYETKVLTGEKPVPETLSEILSNLPKATWEDSN